MRRRARPCNWLLLLAWALVLVLVLVLQLRSNVYVLVRGWSWVGCAWFAWNGAVCGVRDSNE